MRNPIFSKNAPVFALAALMLTFFQMYSKLYYSTAPRINMPIIDIIVALIAGAGLATVTMIIIIHSKNRVVPVFFAFLDFISAFLFFQGKLLEASAIQIATTLFLPLLKASAIFFLSEIFLRYHNDKEEEANEIVRLETKMKKVESERLNLETNLAQAINQITEATTTGEACHKELKRLQNEIEENVTNRNELITSLNELKTNHNGLVTTLESYQRAFPTEAIKNTLNRLDPNSERAKLLSKLLAQESK